MLLVGVTGSIGMGKSTVAQMFKEHGYGVYNADDTVHYIYENDGEVIEKVERKFPGSTKNGVVNRLALRDILNKDPDKFRDLEQIVHPVTRKYQIIYIKKLIEEGKMGCVLDIPLLFETGGEKYVDIIKLNKNKIIGWIFRRNLDYVSLYYERGDLSRKFLWSCEITSLKELEKRLNNTLNK